jgi:hypothetical protein
MAHNAQKTDALASSSSPSGVGALPHAPLRPKGLMPLPQSLVSEGLIHRLKRLSVFMSLNHIHFQKKERRKTDNIPAGKIYLICMLGLGVNTPPQ